MLGRKIIDIGFDIRTKHIHILCGKTVEFLHVTHSVTKRLYRADFLHTSVSKSSSPGTLLLSFLVNMTT